MDNTSRRAHVDPRYPFSELTGQVIEAAQTPWGILLLVLGPPSMAWATMA